MGVRQQGLPAGPDLPLRRRAGELPPRPGEDPGRTGVRRRRAGGKRRADCNRERTVAERDGHEPSARAEHTALSAPVASAAPWPAPRATPPPQPPAQSRCRPIPTASPPLPPPVAEAVKKEAQEIAALQSAQAAFSRGEPLPGLPGTSTRRCAAGERAGGARIKVPKAKSARQGEHARRQADARCSKTRDEDAAEARKKKLIRALTGDVAGEDLPEAGEETAPRLTVVAWRKTRAGRTSTSAARLPMETGSIGAP